MRQVPGESGWPLPTRRNTASVSLNDTITAITAEFDGLPAWEDRYKRIIALAKTLPAMPEALKDDFTHDTAKISQWRSFTGKNQLSDTPELSEIAALLQTFLWPVNQAARTGQTYTGLWNPGIGWQEPESNPRTSSKR